MSLRRSANSYIRLIFFFSSRRRHTRCSRDWSSDVCSSDLLNSFARREDVDISQSAHIGVWAAPRAWGYPSGQAGVGVEVSGQLAAPWHGGFAVLSGAGDGVFTADQPHSGRGASPLSVVRPNPPGPTF